MAQSASERKLDSNSKLSNISSIRWSHFAILLNHLDEMAMKPFVKWIRKRRREASLSAIFCLIHFETRNPTTLLVIQTLLPEFGAEKFWEWNSPKGAWSITSFSFLQHIFYNSSFNKSSLAGIFHANDFPLTGSSLVQRLRCPCRARVFLPTNATGSIQSFRALQKFWKPRVLRSFCLSVNVTKYANLSRTHWSEKIVFQVLTGRICFL